MNDIVKGLRRIAEEGYRFAADAADEIERLRASLEAAETDAAHQKALAESALRVVEGWEEKCNSLRAKIEQMEKQAPFDADSDVFKSAFEAALKAGNWPAARQGDGYRSPSTQIAWRIAFSTVNRLKLYALPGAQPKLDEPSLWQTIANGMITPAHIAQPAPSVPDHKTIKDLLNKSGLCAYDREGDLAFMVAATKFAALAAAPGSGRDDQHAGELKALNHQGLMERARQNAKKEAGLIYPDDDARREEKEQELASEYYRQYTQRNTRVEP